MYDYWLGFEECQEHKNLTSKLKSVLNKQGCCYLHYRIVKFSVKPDTQLCFVDSFKKILHLYIFCIVFFNILSFVSSKNIIKWMFNEGQCNINVAFSML